MSFWPRMLLGEARVGHGDERVELRRGLDVLARSCARPRTLLVPTSRPTGFVPETRSSIFSSASCDLPEMVLRSSAIRYPPLRAVVRPRARRASDSAAVRGLRIASVPDLLARATGRRGPAARAGPPPRSSPVSPPPSSERRSASRTPGQGSSNDLQEVLVVAEAEGATLGAGRAYWSGRPKASNGKPRAQSRWWPMQVLLRVDAGRARASRTSRPRSRSAAAGSR